MLDKLIATADRPRGFWGNLMIVKMNIMHAPLSRWGLSFFRIGKNSRILEVGCGGGQNIKRLRKLAPEGQIIGLDYASLSIKRSAFKNIIGFLKGQIAIMQGNVAALPFKDGYFDGVTAFETIYYWPDLKENFKEVKRVLKPEGQFLIVNEDRVSEETTDQFDHIKDILEIEYYTDEAIIDALKTAGFEEIEVHDHANGAWLAIVARGKKL